MTAYTTEESDKIRLCVIDLGNLLVETMIPPKILAPAMMIMTVGMMSDAGVKEADAIRMFRKCFKDARKMINANPVN